MRFSSLQVLQTDSSGLVKGSLLADPSVSTNSTYFSGSPIFDEWPAIQTLWSEVKLVQFEVRIVPTYINDSKTANDSVLAIAGNLSNVAAPTSYNTVIDNADSHIYPIVYDTSARGTYHSIRPTNINFAATFSPAPGPYAGCPGAILIYGGNALPTSTVIGQIQVRGTYLLRSRS